MNLALSNIWLIVGIAAAAAFAMSLVLLFIPSELRDPVLRGYRATRRREALEQSALLRLAWPVIRLCTYYAQLTKMAEWKEKTSLKLRNAGEPWGLSPDEFLGLTIAATASGFLGSFLFAYLTGMGYGIVIVGSFLGIVMPGLWLNEKAQGRLQSINRGLPQALDLIVLSMGAGLDFVGAR